MERSEITLDITEIQVQAARLNEQFFFWRLVTDTGKVVDQYDPVTGQSQQFPNWVTWVNKSSTDPYAGQPAFTGVSQAFWIPVFENNNGAYHVQLGDASSVVLFRKNYVKDTGSRYTVYCLGLRWDTDNPVERVYHICPPTRYHKADGTTLVFPGAVTMVTDPLGTNAFDDFLKQHL